MHCWASSRRDFATLVHVVCQVLSLPRTASAFGPDQLFIWVVECRLLIDQTVYVVGQRTQPLRPLGQLLDLRIGHFRLPRRSIPSSIAIGTEVARAAGSRDGGGGETPSASPPTPFRGTASHAIASPDTNGSSVHRCLHGEDRHGSRCRSHSTPGTFQDLQPEGHRPAGADQALQSATSDSTGYWKGPKADRFRDDWQEVKPTFEKWVTTLNEAGKSAQTSADNIERAT